MTDEIDILQADSAMSPDDEDMNRNNVALIIDVGQLPVELQDGVLKLIDYAPDRNLINENAMQDNTHEFKWYISFAYDHDLVPGELTVTSYHARYQEVPIGDRFEIYVRYHRKIEAFRAIGNLLGAARDPTIPSGEHGPLVTFNEKSQFTTHGVLIDCSRNGVIRPKHVYNILCIMALMGLNMLQLYTEDTFEMDGEPLFGYLRGKYTKRELASIDDYAFDLGIEVIPCIQTLGHLGQILQWPQYAYLRDNVEVLLAEAEETYDFLEKMIKTAASPFRSKRIHLGMDEAHGLGESRYRQLFGYRDPMQIFVDHLQRVNEICLRLDLQPMIWSDMLFCLAAKNNSLQGYYDENNNPATPELVASMPNNVKLIFWDYYHTSTEHYAQKLQQHRDLGCQQPWMATSAWTWGRLWTSLPFSFETIRASTVAAKRKDDGVENTFITIWGDEGNEVDMYSALPALHFYAQHIYTEHSEIDMFVLKRNFGAICGGHFDDWVFASKLDEPPAGMIITPTTHYVGNMSKWLLWEDPILGFMSPQYADDDLETYYSVIARRLFDAARKPHFKLNTRLEFPALIASVLSLKCHLRQKCAEAYRNHQHKELYDLAQGRLLPLREQVDRLWRHHRAMWMNMYKPFGWEVLELRYSGIRTRLETMYDRIISYVETRVMGAKDGTSGDMGGEEVQDDDEDEPLRIPEFETDLECLFAGSRTHLLLDYARVATPARPG